MQAEESEHVSAGTSCTTPSLRLIATPVSRSPSLRSPKAMPST